MKNKYCFKADGTQLTSSKIATALGLLGEINVGGFTFDSAINCYYFLQDNDLISHSESIPTGYELVNVDEFLARYKPNPFPKRMWVSDIGEDDAKKTKIERLIIAHYEELIDPWIAVCESRPKDIALWRFAVDIPEEEPEQPIREIPVNEAFEMLSQWTGVPIDKIRIKGDFTKRKSIK